MPRVSQKIDADRPALSRDTESSAQRCAAPPEAGVRQVAIYASQQEDMDLLALAMLRGGVGVQPLNSAEEVFAAAGHPASASLLSRMSAVVLWLDSCSARFSQDLWSLRGVLGEHALLAIVAPAKPDQLLELLRAGCDEVLIPAMGREFIVQKLSTTVTRAAKARAEVAAPNGTTTRVGPATISSTELELTCGGEVVPLTPSEHGILRMMAEADGRVVSRSDLLSAVKQTGEHSTPRSLDTHVYTLRAKLERTPLRIETVRGMGYRVRTATKAPVQPSRAASSTGTHAGGQAPAA